MANIFYINFLILNFIYSIICLDYLKNKDIKMTKKSLNPHITELFSSSSLQIKIDRKSTFIIVYYDQWAEKK